MELGALQRDDLARADLVDLDAPECGQRARLTGKHVTLVLASNHERAEAPGIACRIHGVAHRDQHGERADQL